MSMVQHASTSYAKEESFLSPTKARGPCRVRAAIGRTSHGAPGGAALPPPARWLRRLGGGPPLRRPAWRAGSLHVMAFGHLGVT